MEPLTVSVFDDDEIFRRGVVSCLSDDPLLAVVNHGSVCGGGTVPDVAVVGAYGSTIPSCPLVICAEGRCLPRWADDDRVMAVLGRRTLAPDQLVSAVRAAAVGLRIFDARSLNSDLDDRTVTVLRMLADGAAVREISGSLGWSERTIKGVIANIQREFHTRTRTQTVVEAVRRQLI